MIKDFIIKYGLHLVLNFILLCAAWWIYYDDSPVMVIGGIIGWLYVKELEASTERKKIKELQNCFKNLKNQDELKKN